MRRKQANPKPVKVEGDEMPGTTDSAQSQQSPSPAHGQSSNRESSDVDEYDGSMVIDTGSVRSAQEADGPDVCEDGDSPESDSREKYSIIELHRSVEMVYYADGNVEDGESEDAMISSGDSSCGEDKDLLSLSGSVRSNSEVSNNLSIVSLADASFQETDQTSAAAAAAKSKHSLSKSRKKTDRILPKTGVDGEKKYFCPVCEDAFSSEHEFTRHIRSHNSPTNVSTVNMCMICQKVLSSQSSLDRHMLVHSGERPFKCESCGQAFTTNGNMHRHMRTHKNAQANAGLPNELVPKIRKKKRQQLMPSNAEDATSTQQLPRQVAQSNSVGRSTMSRKRKMTDSGRDVEVSEKRSDVVKYLLTLPSSHDSAKMSSMITQSSARIDPTKYPLQCSECHTTFFSRFHLLTDLEEHERCQRNSLSVTCAACEVKLNCVNDFGDHMLSAHCSPKEGAVLEGSENIKPAFNELMAVVPFTSERFSQMYKIITEKPSKHQLQRSAVNYCFGCEQMSERSYGGQTKKLGPNCSGSFCDFCRFFFYKCEQQKDNVLWQERDVILSGYSNQKMDSDKVIQDKMAKTEFLHMLDLKSHSESKIKHSKSSLQFDANQNVIKVLSNSEKPPFTLKSLPLLNVLQSSILPKLSLTEGTVVNHVWSSSAVGEETLAPNNAPVLNLSSISAKHIVALIEGSKVLPMPGSIKIDLPRLMVGSPAIDEERILPRLEDPMDATIKLEADERDSSTEATDPPLSSTTGSLQFKCSQCVYSSTDRSTLVRHMRTHNGERPFKCLYCNYQFTTKANCERHIKKKHSAEHREPDANGINSIQLPADSSSSARSHPGRHYQCKACPKNFASRANLLRHNQRQHSDLLNRSLGGHTGGQSGESLICNGLALLANEAENCSRQLSSNSDENVPLQLTSSKSAVEARQQPQTTSSTYRGYAENAEDSDEPLDFSLKSQRTSGQSDCVGHSLESNEPIDLTIRGQGQQRRVPRECENTRSGRRVTMPHVMLKLSSPAKGSAGDKAWIKKQQLLPSVSAAKAPPVSDLRSVLGHFCCSVCRSVFKHKVELSVHMRSHNIEMDSQLHGEACSSTMDVKPDSLVKTALPQFTVVASSTFFSSSSPLNKKLDFDKSPVLPKEPNNNVASSLNANFVIKPLEIRPLNLLKGDLASVNQILESTSGKQLQPLLAMTNSTASPSLSPSTSFHGLPDLEVSTNEDHGFVDAISTSIAQNIILKNKGANGKREAEAMDDDEEGAEFRTIKKKRNSYADSPRKLLCEFCTRAFPWISSLKRHILTHTGQKPYRCKQCGTTFSTKSNRERHMIRKHGLDVHDPTTRQTMDRPYKCHLCVFSSFTTSGKLMRHYKVKHPDKEVPETLLMSTGSLSLDDSDLMDGSGMELLTAEQRAEMMSSDEEDENEDPTDDEVNELTYQMMAKSRLMQTLNQTDAASSGSLMTPVNGGGGGGVSHLFMVATKDNVDVGSAEKHINPERDNYNVDKITDCWKCKRTFNDRKTLLRHLKEHNIDLPFKCYLCDASFEDRLMSLEHKHDEHPSDWATVQDKNKVTNLKDYSEFMEAVVKDTLDGKVTRRTHEGVELDIKPEPDYAQRKVFCTLCPKRFWSLQDLRRHMRSHTGDRPFECDICLSRFTLKHSMVRHRRKHITEGLGASGEAQCSASDEDSVNMSTTPVEEGCAQHSPKMSADSPDESARVSLSLGQVLPGVTAAATTHLLVSGESSTQLSKSSSLSSLKIVFSPNKATSSVDQSDLLQTLLDIDDTSTIDRMLESPTNAASMLGIRRPKTE